MAASVAGQNVIASSLPDKIGEIDERMRVLKAEAAPYQDELKTQGPGVYVGDNYQYTVSESVQWGLNTDELEAFLQKHGRTLDDFRSPGSTVVRGTLAAASRKNKDIVASRVSA